MKIVINKNKFYNMVKYISIASLIILNLYGNFLQSITGINSFVFLIIPLIVLIILSFRNFPFALTRNLEFICVFSLMGICFFQIFYTEGNIESVKNLFYIFIFFVIVQNADLNSWNVVKNTIFGCSFLMTIDVLMQIPKIIALGYRIYNVRQYTMLDKPWYSLIFSFVIILIVIDLINNSKSKKVLKSFKIFYFILLFFLNAWIIQSKITFFSTLIGIIVLFMNLKKNQKRKIIGYLIPVTFILSVIFILNFDFISIYVPDYIKVMMNKMFGLYDTSIKNYGIYEGTYTARFDIYLYCIDLIKRYPLFGVGFGNFAEIGMREVNVIEAESSILNTFVEGGILYGLLHLILYFVIINNVRNALKSQNKYTRNVYIEMLIILILYFIFNLQNDYMTATYWVIIAVINANTYKKNKMEMFT